MCKMCKSIGKIGLYDHKNLGRWHCFEEKRHYILSQLLGTGKDCPEWTNLKVSVASIAQPKRKEDRATEVEAVGQEFSTKPYVRYVYNILEGVRRASYTCPRHPSEST